MVKYKSKYFFIKRVKHFFKTTYFFYKSTLNDINNKKDYSETEPFIKIIVRRFSDSTKISLLTNDNLIVGNINYLDSVNEWHFKNGNKNMIIKCSNIEGRQHYLIRGLFVLLINDTINEKFLKSYYKEIIKIVRSNKITDIKYILENLNSFKRYLAIKTYKNYDISKEDTCCICFAKNDKSERIKLQCNHSFHLDCFSKWYKEKRSCPLCKFELKISDFICEKDCSLYPVKPYFNNNRLNLNFLPLKNGKESMKNIKLKSTSGNKFKFLKTTDNNFVVEYSEPLKELNAIAVSIVNFLT